MARRERDSTVLPTIWHAPDDLWDKIKSILDEHDRRKHMGRKRIDQRGALEGIIFRMRSGCQWNQLPKENPDDSSVHGTFQRWGRTGVKRGLLVEADGGPLAAVVVGANVHDTKVLEATLDAIVVKRPQPTAQKPQHL